MPEILAAEELTLTPGQIASNRWYYERDKLRLFPSFALLGVAGQITAAEGALTTQFGNSYSVRIVLDGYPNALPKIFPKGWTIHPGVTHKFPDGNLCIMRSDQWRRHFTIALVVAKTAIWLNKYELWKRNGNRWPGLEQRH